MAIHPRNRVPSAAANGKNGHTLISDAKFRQLYALALKLQLLALGSNGHGEGARALAGREAALAGLAADLLASDRILVRETPLLSSALGETWPGSQNHAGEGSFSHLLIGAVGAPATDRIRQNRRVTVIFCDESVDRQVFSEARRVAVAAKLPVIFVEHGAETEKPRADLGNAAPQSEEIAIPVDAQDIVAIYRVAHESITRAREGSGPTRIQCVEWKPAAHGRRAASTGSPDPVQHLEAWLAARGLPAQAWRQQIAAEFTSQQHESEGPYRPAASPGEHAVSGRSPDKRISSSTIHA